MRAFACLIAGLFSVLCAAATQNTSDELTLPNFVVKMGEKGRFTQQKYFAKLSKPFESKGYFVLAQDELEWVTETPVKQRLVFRNGQVNMTNAAGVLEPVQGAQPFVAVLAAMLSSDIAALRSHFSISAMSDTCAQLLPKQGALASVFSQIEMCTDDLSSSITLHDSGGNRTVITLAPQ